MAARQRAKPAESESTALVNWDEELARQAEIAAAQEANTGGGQFFGLRGGILTFNDAPLPNNEVAVVILDSILENVYYEGDYDPENPAPPTCFAHGRDDTTIAPHDLVKAAGQVPEGGEDGCSGCPMNEWGSADKGRGKACRNTRRLALLAAGVFAPNGAFKMADGDELQKGAIAFMKLPVTSVRGYATFVKQVAGALKRPPHGIITKIKVVPDVKSQFKVLFEPMQPLSGAVLGAVMQRHEEAKKVIDFPYMLDTAEPEPAPQARGRATPKGKAAAAPKTTGRRGGKY